MNRRLLFAILSTAFFEQVVITIVRVATTYRAVELDLSVVWVGIITAVYAVLPIAIGVPLGALSIAAMTPSPPGSAPAC